MKWKKVEVPKKKEKIRVVWYSNTPEIPTGFAEVTRNVCSRLANDPRYDVYVIGENYTGNPTTFDNFNVVGRGKDEKELNALKRWLDKLKPDVLITLEDTFTLANQGFHSVIFETPWIQYVPMDGYGIPTSGSWILRNCDKIVSMSKYTKKVLDDENFVSDVIYHGVDLYDFRPVNEHEKSFLKNKYGFKQDDVVCTIIARNSVRKRNQRFLEAAVKACLLNPKLKFFCHLMNYKTRDLDLQEFLTHQMNRKYGVDMFSNGRIVLNPKGINPYQRVTDNEVSEYIKMADFTATSTSGEGFGMLMTNSMACAVPSISTDYTTSKELLDDVVGGIGKRGLLVKCKAYDTTSYNVEHALADIEDLTEQILWSANHPTELKEMGKNGRKFVEKYCNWSVIANEWKKVIEEVI